MSGTTEFLSWTVIMPLLWVNVALKFLLTFTN